MKKILQCIGALIYGTIFGELMFLLFSWLIPIVMNLKLGWFIILLLIGELLFLGIMNFITTILIVPYMLIANKCNTAKVLGIIPIVFAGISAIIGVWTMSGTYHLSHWVIGITMTFTILSTFGGIVIAPFKMEE